MRLLLFKHKETSVRYLLFKKSVYTWSSLQRDYPLLQECEFVEDTPADFDSANFPLDKLLMEVMEYECSHELFIEEEIITETKKKKK